MMVADIIHRLRIRVNNQVALAADLRLAINALMRLQRERQFHRQMTAPRTEAQTAK